MLINDRAALRVGDWGSNTPRKKQWLAVQGAPCVSINGRPAHRMQDEDNHRGSEGHMIEGSPNVLIGDHTGPAKTAWHWIGVEVLNAHGDPVPGIPFEVTGPVSFRGRTEAAALKRIRVPAGEYTLRILSEEEPQGTGE